MLAATVAFNKYKSYRKKKDYILLRETSIRSGDDLSYPFEIQFVNRLIFFFFVDISLLVPSLSLFTVSVSPSLSLAIRSLVFQNPHLVPRDSFSVGIGISWT